MSILVNRQTRVLVSGITGREGSFHTTQMLAYKTNIIAGVTPGKGGQDVAGVPVFNTIDCAVRETGANTAVIFVPPAFAFDAVLEAIESRIELIVCITEGMPVSDAVRIRSYLSRQPGSRLLGPNSPGVISPGECFVGIMPPRIFTKGPIGLVSRSGTLLNEVSNALSQRGIGQSTCVGIGGDPVLGMCFLDVLKLFEQDVETSVIVLIGEIGGTDEEDAAAFIKEASKPVVAFIAGRSAPPEKQLGHAGAIISGKTGNVDTKLTALREAGALTADTIDEVADLVSQELKRV